MTSSDRTRELLSASQRQGGVATGLLGLTAGFGYTGHWTAVMIFGCLTMLMLAVSKRADDRVLTHLDQVLSVGGTSVPGMGMSGADECGDVCRSPIVHPSLTGPYPPGNGSKHSSVNFFHKQRTFGAGGGCERAVKLD